MGAADVLAAVREQWLPTAVAVRHLPVGFGAHHWVAHDRAGPELFVTLDSLRTRHTARTLEATYAAAAALHQAGLEFVVPCLRSAEGGFTVPLAEGALSATRGSMHNAHPTHRRRVASSPGSMPRLPHISSSSGDYWCRPPSRTSWRSVC